LIFLSRYAIKLDSITSHDQPSGHTRTITVTITVNKRETTLTVSQNEDEMDFYFHGGDIK
jgi:hypothetical protein